MNYPEVYNSLVDRRLLPYWNSFNNLPIIQETPETIIAKTDYRSALKLLEAESVRRHYSKLSEIGQSIVNTYVNNLNSDDVRGLRRIVVEPEVVMRRNWLGRPISRAMIISFERED